MRGKISDGWRVLWITLTTLFYFLLKRWLMRLQVLTSAPRTLDHEWLRTVQCQPSISISPRARLRRRDSDVRVCAGQRSCLCLSICVCKVSEVTKRRTMDEKVRVGGGGRGNLTTAYYSRQRSSFRFLSSAEQILRCSTIGIHFLPTPFFCTPSKKPFFQRLSESWVGFAKS